MIKDGKPAKFNSDLKAIIFGFPMDDFYLYYIFRQAFVTICDSGYDFSGIDLKFTYVRKK